MVALMTVLKEDYETAYRRLVDFGDSVQNANGECAIVCPVHDDTKGSLKINIYNGLWNCFGCGEGGSNPISMYCWLHQCDWPDASEDLETIFTDNRPSVTDYSVNKNHAALLSNLEAMEALNKRGINLNTIRQYRLGWFEERLCLPECG